MKLSIAAFTRAGGVQMKQIAEAFWAAGDEIISLHGFWKGASERPISLSEWTGSAFLGDAIIFVGACGIAVRAIAPYIKDKFTDPAVVTVDEQGRFVVPLLSGHVGGANELAQRVAQITQGTAVISTATDLNKRFAVDVWAKEHMLLIAERVLAKKVSAALLAGETVGFRSDFPFEGVLPKGLSDTKNTALGIHVTLDEISKPFSQTLHLIPRRVILGAGCRRGVTAEVFERAVLDALAAHRISVRALCGLRSIDLKKEECCMAKFCEKYQLQAIFYTAEQLMQVQGEFTASEFVRTTTGVDNVCERAAKQSGGQLLMHKQSGNGVTAAAALLPVKLSFLKNNGESR